MKTLILYVPIHSIVDLITNSSSEIFLFKLNKEDETAKLLLEALISLTGSDCDSTTVKALSGYRYKDEIILPEGTNESDVYIANIAYSDSALENIIKKVFTIVNVTYK